MACAKVPNSLMNIIAFARHEGSHPDAFVVTSYAIIWRLPLKIELSGTQYKTFIAYRTLEDGTEQYQKVGIFEVQDHAIMYDPPYGSTTTFIGIP